MKLIDYEDEPTGNPVGCLIMLASAVLMCFLIYEAGKFVRGLF